MNSIINIFKKREKYWFDKIAPFLGEETVQILKIGNGFGYMSEMISDIQPLVKILDINIYKETINKDKVQLYNGRNIPFEDNSFNISILNLTLHHIPNNLEYFKEVVRVTKNRIILVEETYDNLLQKVHLIFRDWFVNYKAGRSSRLFWSSYFSKKMIEQLISENNLVLTYRYSEKHHSYYKELLVFERSIL